MNNFVSSVPILSRTTVRVQGEMISLENRSTCAKILFCNIPDLFFTRNHSLPSCIIVAYDTSM